MTTSTAKPAGFCQSHNGRVLPLTQQQGEWQAAEVAAARQGTVLPRVAPWHDSYLSTRGLDKVYIRLENPTQLHTPGYRGCCIMGELHPSCSKLDQRCHQHHQAYASLSHHSATSQCPCTSSDDRNCSFTHHTPSPPPPQPTPPKSPKHMATIGRPSRQLQRQTAKEVPVMATGERGCRAPDQPGT